MSWVLVIGTTWLLLAVLIALLIGRAIHVADIKADEAVGGDVHEPNFAVDLAPVRALHPQPEARNNAESDEKEPMPNTGAPTIPGIPAARPRLAPPAVPPPSRPSYRETGLA